MAFTLRSPVDNSMSMNLPPLVFRFLAVALAAVLAPACGEQETEENGYHPVVMTDTDRDGIPDICEAFFGTDPNNFDTDNDAVADGSEDHDGDGYTNYQEMAPYGDKGLCPPPGDAGKEAAADVEVQDAAADGEPPDATPDATTDAAPEAEIDAQAEAAAEDASDAEATDAAAE